MLCGLLLMDMTSMLARLEHLISTGKLEGLSMTRGDKP